MGCTLRLIPITVSRYLVLALQLAGRKVKTHTVQDFNINKIYHGKHYQYYQSNQLGAILICWDYHFGSFLSFN